MQLIISLFMASVLSFLPSVDRPNSTAMVPRASRRRGGGNIVLGRPHRSHEPIRSYVMRVLLPLMSLMLACPAWAGGPSSFVTPHETIPNFAQAHTIQSVRAGPWSSAVTWNPARVPGASDIVSVVHPVTYDSQAGDVRVIGIEPGGVLSFVTNQSTSLRVSTILVMPGGTLEIGTVANPIAAGVRTEVIIKNTPLNTSTDPTQMGTGLLGLGTVTMHGAVKQPTWQRVAQAPLAGHTSFSLAQAVSGWRVGDLVMIPDTRQEPTEDSDGRITYRQVEERTIQSISGDGRTVSFSPGLQYNHRGTTDENGDGRPDYLPHIGNLTRNILIRSESRTGTRGHVLFLHRAAVDMRYVAFQDLGRTTFHNLDSSTNHIGRYALHLHHLYGPSPTVDPTYQYRLVGNAIYELAPTPPPQKWGITLHDSHYGLIAGNVVYNLGGAGIVTEDGSESHNLIQNNFVVKISSNGGRDEHFDQTRGIAREGVGFWFRGTNNRVRGNVAANMGESTNDVEASYGFKYNMVQLGNVRQPNFRGADTSVSGQYTTRQGNSLPILEFDGNEIYGQIQGLTLWWLCSIDFNPVTSCGESVLRNIVVWHTSRYAYYGYPAYNYVFDNVRVYGDPAIAGGSNHEFKSIWWYGDYGTGRHTLRNSAFYNTVGWNDPYFRTGEIRAERNVFKSRSGIIHRKSAAPGSCPTCNLPDHPVIATGNRAVAMAGQEFRTYTLSSAQVTDPANADRLFICDHQGVAGDSFEVFFTNYGAPPCTATRPDIANAYVCATAAVQTYCPGSASDTIPPAAPTGLSASN